MYTKIDKNKHVRNNLEHNEIKPIPYNLSFLRDAEEKIIRYYKLDTNKDLYDFIGNYLLEICPSYYDFTKMNDGSEFYTDFYGIKWKRDKSALTRGRIEISPIIEPDLSNYKFPDLDKKHYYKDLKLKIEKSTNKFILVWIDGIFERSGFLRGFENLLIDFYKHPLFIEELFSKQLECDLVQIKNICKYGIDGIFISDDYGYQDGLVMNPETWKKFIKPNLKKLVSFIHSKGKYAFLHSDGKIDKVVPDLVDIEMDAINPVESEIMDYKRLKKEFGKYISFYGGISNQNILAFGKPEDIKRDIIDKIDVLGKGGGYIAGTGITPPPNIPLENLIILIETLKSQ